MAGRKPKPTHLHVINGNPSKKPLNSTEPKPERGIPECPAWLSEKAKAAWEKAAPWLEKMGVLTRADGIALEGLVEAYADWLQAHEDLRVLGSDFYETEDANGNRQVKAYPSVRIKADADRRMRAWLSEFGLTPAARARLGSAVDGGKKADPWADF